MRVLKRGSRGFESVKFDKITARIANLCLDLAADPLLIAKNTIQSLYDGISTEELDCISAKIAESFKLVHPDYSILAGNLLISNLHKSTSPRFSEAMRKINDNLDILSPAYYAMILKHADALDAMIDHKLDYNFTYFGYKTLERSYLLRIKDGAREIIVDRPQYVYMRVAIAMASRELFADREFALERVRETYELLAHGYYTHATPTLFNACGKVQQLNSCFLLGTEDSIEGIMRTVSEAALISKWSGGIGIHMHCIRSRNQYIAGTNGRSSGLTKQLKIYNEIARTFDQGGKRLGAFAVYLEPWHGDILRFLQMKLSQGADEERARDLFYALWVPDLFMRRVRAGAKWSLFSENVAPHLSDVYDGMEVCKISNYCANPAYNRIWPVRAGFEEFRDYEFEARNVFSELYEQYEREGRAVQVIEAREVVDAICEMQRESGTPYICFKDHVNRQSNQMGIGTIKSSNLCAEIMEYSGPGDTANCVLASVNVKKATRRVDGALVVDHAVLHDVVEKIVCNLDGVIDINNYPVESCVANARDYRPIGIGIQGLADLFARMRIPFCSPEAERIDVEIAETIYHAALTSSCRLAAERGSHVGFEKTPAARGLLHFDLWQKNQKYIGGMTGAALFSGRYDWSAIKSDIATHGLRNSLLVAMMPTVSTSQIMANNESFEPFSSNIYTKNTLNGKFTITNTEMINHFIELGIWNIELKEKIVMNDGSVQGLAEVPLPIQEIYKTVWEMKQTELMRRCALRGAFVDQSQSLNIHLRDNSNSVLRGVIMRSWELGLKTGSYYIRTLPASKAMKTSVTFCTKECLTCSS